MIQRLRHQHQFIQEKSADLIEQGQYNNSADAESIADKGKHGGNVWFLKPPALRNTPAPFFYRFSARQLSDYPHGLSRTRRAFRHFSRHANISLYLWAADTRKSHSQRQYRTQGFFPPCEVAAL